MGVGVGVAFVVAGVAIAILGGVLYSACSSVGGAPSTGPGGQVTYPSGCGPILFLVGFGALFSFLGVVAAATSMRTSTYIAPPWNGAAPPPIFDPNTGVPLPPAPRFPPIRCRYCGALAPSGSVRCPSCGASP